MRPPFIGQGVSLFWTPVTKKPVTEEDVTTVPSIALSCASYSFDICYKRCGNVSSNFYLYFPSSFFSFIFIVPLMIIMILWQIHPQFLGKGNFKLNLLRVTLVPLATFPLGNDRVSFQRF